MIVKDIISTVHILLDNATESELELSVVLELFGSMLTMMKYEQVYGNLDEVIRKQTVTFPDLTGRVINTLPEFGDVVYLKFNGEYIDESPVSQLELYSNAGTQRVAFWTDASTDTNYIEQSIATQGTLDIWYEPYSTADTQIDAVVDIKDSMKWCLASRLALTCLPYVKFRSPIKMANKAQIAMNLNKIAEDWKQVYLESVNRIGTAKPFTKIPYMASRRVN